MKNSISLLFFICPCWSIRNILIYRASYHTPWSCRRQVHSTLRDLERKNPSVLWHLYFIINGIFEGSFDAEGKALFVW